MIDLAQHAEKIVRHLLGEPSPVYSTASQLRYGTNGSLAIDIAGEKAGLWHDFEAETGGGMIALINREKGFKDGEAWTWLRDELDIKTNDTGIKYQVTGTWVYRDRDGSPLFRVIRRDAPGKPKLIHQERYNPATSSYIGGKGAMKGVKLVPYRLPEWADGDEPVLIAEGERKADTLLDLGFISTCNAMGAGKWPEHFGPAYLADRDTILLPDNDGAGRDHVRRVATSLQPVAASVRILELPGLPDKGDIVDWVRAGGTAEQLQALLDQAPDATTVLAGWKAETEPAEEPKTVVQDRFKRTDRGVYRLVEDKEGNRDWTWFASYLEVAADTRNASSESWGRLLVVVDRDGKRHEWAMPMSMLAGGGDEYRRYLLDLGLQLAPSSFGRNSLHEYITLWKPQAKARCVERVGWHEDVFVLPDRSFGADGSDERVLLQTTGRVPEFSVQGTMDGWQTELAALAIDNSRLAFSLSIPFAGPLLRPAREESGGFHPYGASSIGKTTALHAARSVYGQPYRSWRTTDNELENLARCGCDAFLPLDEISQADAKTVDAIAYMLANGVGKARMRRDASSRPAITWRLIFLSTGEKGLAAKLGEINRRAQAGQGVRVIEIPADAGKGLGLFESLHGSPNGDAFSRRVRAAAEAHYGHAGRAFLAAVVPQIETIIEVVITARDQWVAANCPAGADGQVNRVAGRFGLVAAAGELAAALGILPWPKGEADRAAVACFEAWLKDRGSTGPLEARDGLAQGKAFVEAHGSSRFEDPWQEQLDGVSQKIFNRAGFRRRDDDGNWQYFILPEIWRTEVCKGFDARAIAQAMIECGWMEPGDGKNLARRIAIPHHGKPRLYCITPRIFDGGEP